MYTNLGVEYWSHAPTTSRPPFAPHLPDFRLVNTFKLQTTALFPRFRELVNGVARAFPMKSIEEKKVHTLDASDALRCAVNLSLVQAGIIPFE